VALAVVYVPAARLGLSLAYLHPSATPVWPPTGIALAALLILGQRVWPGVFLGAFVANIWISGAIAPSLGIAVGNTLEAVVGAWLVNRFAGGRHAFERPRDIFRFAALAALASTTISATIGISSLCLGGLAQWADFGPIWITWWLGDASGCLIVAPVLLAWRWGSPGAHDWRRRLETTLLLAGVVAVGLVVFGGLIPSETRDLPLEFLCLPLLVAIAFRLGVREAAAANLLLSAVAIWGTLRGTGPFHRPNPNESLLLLQAFAGVVALTTMALAAVVAERRRVSQALALLESAVDGAAEGVVILEAGVTASRPRITFVNAAFSRMTGLSSGEALGQSLDVLPLSPRDAVTTARRAFAVGERFQRDVLTRLEDGSERSIEVQVMPVPERGSAAAYWVAILRDVSERRRHLAALEHQALHDALTGLPNRMLLLDRLDQSVKAALRDGGTLAVLLIDLDRFKQINDTFGHATGDALLTQVGSRLRGALRSVDTIARYGGDEFVVLLPAAGDRGDAVRAAEKVLETLQTPFIAEGHTLEVAASVGVAVFPDHGSDGEALMRAADGAMYVAKASSLGYAVYSASEDAHQRRRLALLEQLRGGLEAGQLSLAYRPRVDLRTGQLVRFEVLVSWRHPEYGLMFPDDILSGAERIGANRQLTDWVLETALQQCGQWHAAGGCWPVAINAPARLLKDLAFAERVRALQERLRLGPDVLMLGITECLAAEPLDVLPTLGALRTSGVRLSLDDFGGGSLSLLTLQQLAVDEICIGEAFVGRMPQRETDAAIVRSLIDLAHHLGCKVVAEGVHSEAAWMRLLELGCDLAQGDYVGPPLSADEVPRWIAGRTALASG
jgi:diguanylate cyclase (GGDEF)-like protein/PAS domain S-box-containing protein